MKKGWRKIHRKLHEFPRPLLCLVRVLSFFDAQEKSRDTWLCDLSFSSVTGCVRYAASVYASIADFSLWWWYFHVSLSFMHVFESRRKSCCLMLFSRNVLETVLGVNRNKISQRRSLDALTKRYFFFSCRTKIRKRSLIVSTVKVFLPVSIFAIHAGIPCMKCSFATRTTFFPFKQESPVVVYLLPTPRQKGFPS